MKQFIKITGMLSLVLILIRGPVYRWLITYDEIGERQEIEITSKHLIEKIVSKSKNTILNLENIVAIADEITKKELSFTTKKASNNPNILIDLKQANCVGYAAMFNSIANFLIKKNNLEANIIAIHKIGQLELLGMNLHQFFDNPFFKDHDFNVVFDKKRGEKIFIDSSIGDYLWIDRIAIK
jgi:nucleoside-triphosphatase THEP1